MIKGVARGGPMDGRKLATRRPAGVLLVDSVAHRVWIYDLVGKAFVVREEEGRPEDELRRWAAADDGQFDVLAAPWIGDESW